MELECTVAAPVFLQTGYIQSTESTKSSSSLLGFHQSACELLAVLMVWFIICGKVLVQRCPNENICYSQTHR